MTCPGPEVTGLGAYVLGALEPGERRRVEEHVDGCPFCTAELVEFRALPALLDRVTPEDLHPVSVTPSPELFARMLSAVSDEGARLLLTDPDGYPVDRIVGFARWLMDQMAT